MRKTLITIIICLLFAPVSIEAVHALEVNDDGGLVINARVSSCEFTYKVYPEKRIPFTNNWSVENTVEIIRNVDGVKVGEFTTTTDNQGNATINLCDQNINVVGDDYNFRIKGLSHLRKNYGPYFAFDSMTENLDFTQTGQRLLAGETSPIFDNVINSMDISTQINYMYSTNIKNDLNRDGIVNSLDISNTITNFFLRGD